ncbi:phosphoribosyltransferase [Bacteroides uniformis]|uniref:phosphoribosyltransferase n=1 Tax=Bacteroides uniformis TaxID=820 RepID=UPI0035B4FF66
MRDGFQTIWIEEEREQMKGTSHKDVVSNLSIKRRDINGMHVILFDDILTTGQSFKQLKRRMIDLGAKSVTGIFLGKTVWLND